MVAVPASAPDAPALLPGAARWSAPPPPGGAPELAWVSGVAAAPSGRVPVLAATLEDSAAVTAAGRCSSCGRKKTMTNASARPPTMLPATKADARVKRCGFIGFRMIQGGTVGPIGCV